MSEEIDVETHRKIVLNIQRHLAHVKEHFPATSRLTLVVRNVEHPDGSRDFMLSEEGEDLSKLVEVIDRLGSMGP